MEMQTSSPHQPYKSDIKRPCSNSYPNSEHFNEESLLPSNLLNESSDSEFFHIKCRNHFHNKSVSHSYKHLTIIEDPPPNMNQYLTPHYILFNSDIKNLINKIKTHSGSIYLQKTLNVLNENEINALLVKLCPHLIEIMCNHYGNYFFQKFIQKLNLNQRMLIFSLIQFNFLIICTDASGTYSIQALLDAIKTESEERLFEKLLNQNLLLLFCNENSHHIIQKVIIDFPEHKREYLNKFILDNVEQLSMNEYGALCLVKFILMNSNLTIRSQLIRILEQKFKFLFTNENSCSVLLFLMEKYGYSYSIFIVNEIKSNLIYYSISKQFLYSLIEKTFEFMSRFENSEFNNLIWSIIKNDKKIMLFLQSQNGSKVFLLLLKYFSVDQKSFFKVKKANLSFSNSVISQETIKQLLI